MYNVKYKLLSDKLASINSNKSAKADDLPQTVFTANKIFWVPNTTSADNIYFGDTEINPNIKHIEFESVIFNIAYRNGVYSIPMDESLKIYSQHIPKAQFLLKKLQYINLVNNERRINNLSHPVNSQVNLNEIQDNIQPKPAVKSKSKKAYAKSIIITQYPDVDSLNIANNEDIRQIHVNTRQVTKLSNNMSLQKLKFLRPIPGTDTVPTSA
jgi:hypothetical protein